MTNNFRFGFHLHSLKKLDNPIPIENKYEPTKGMALLAEPFIGDTHFKRTVILLTEHNKEGSVGFILNKRLELNLNDILKLNTQLEIPLYFGGPVQNNTLHFIHREPAFARHSVEISDGIYWGGNFEEIQESIESNHLDLSNFKFFIGYSGWTKDQLLSEIKEKVWYVSPAKQSDIFNDKYTDMWRKFMNGLGGNFKFLANSPDLPQMN